MTARQAVVAALTAQTGAGQPLHGVRVVGYARNIDPPSKPTVMVRLDEAEPGAGAPNVWRRYAFALVVLPAKTHGSAADDELDALLEDVLYAIEQAPNLTWSKAARGTYQDNSYPAYEVTLSVPFTKE